jgi:hypothetical protein
MALDLYAMTSYSLQLKRAGWLWALSADRASVADDATRERRATVRVAPISRKNRDASPQSNANKRLHVHFGLIIIALVLVYSSRSSFSDQSAPRMPH